MKEHLFNPTSEKIIKLYEQEKNQKAIQLFLNLFQESDKMGVYIDYGNVRPWSTKLKWNVDVRKLGQFFASFNFQQKRRFYYGNDPQEPYNLSISEAKKYFEIITKEIKSLKINIDATSLKNNVDTTLLKSFIRQSFLKKLTLEEVEYLNTILQRLNNSGIKEFHDKKCNFDVEMGIDMMLDYENNQVDTFVLMSHDRDFIEPVKKLLEKGVRKIIMFCPSRGLASEFYTLQSMHPDRLLMFNIEKLRDFLCRKNEEIKEQKI